MKRLLGLLFCFCVLPSFVLFAADAPAERAPGDAPPRGPEDVRTAHHFRITPRLGDAHHDLSTDWNFGFRDSSARTYQDTQDVKEWYVMRRPTTVHRALCEAGVLPEPYVGLNSKQYEWIEGKIWYFKKTFTLTDAEKARVERGDYVFLSFDGMDYYSRAWLNGVHLGWHEGMFGGPEFEVSKLLKTDGENEITVAVGSANVNHPVHNGGRSDSSHIKPWSTAAGSGVEPFYTLGFWRSARLDFAPKTHIERPFLTTRSISPDGKQAVVKFETEVLSGIQSLAVEQYKMHNYQMDAKTPAYGQLPKAELGGKQYAVRLTLSRDGQKFEREFPLEPKTRRSWVRGEVTLENPAIWWPNGLGAQPLYDAKVELLADGKTQDEICFRFGIRTIEWTDSAGPKLGDRWGKWQCVVNGKPVFLKGVNWMPIDVLRDLKPEKYRWYLSLARDAGVRIMRIWGPGFREEEAFYDACDEFGIMVWQDFSIGNQSSDGWPHDVFESEVLQTIYRLRNRTSLAVWCGGNEFNPYCPGNTAKIGIIERDLSEFDGTRKFLRTTPDDGAYHVYPDWDANWYKRSFADYPYLAESGIHSVVSPRSLRSYINPDEYQYANKMYAEEYRTLAPESVHHYVEYFPSRVPRMLTRASHFVTAETMDLEALAFGSQMGAGEFYQAMCEGVQANYPVTTGMMPWVFSRSWPTIAAIQLVDGTGQPVGPYYFVRRAYEPTHVMLDLPRILWKAGETVPMKAKVLNLDLKPAFAGELRVRVLNDSFQTVYEQKKAWGAADSAMDLPAFQIPADYRSRFFFPVAELWADGKLVSRSVYWPRTIPQMETPEFYEKYTTTPVNWPAAAEGFAPLTEAMKKAPKSAVKLEILGEKTTRDGSYRLTEYAVRVQNTAAVPSVITWFDLEPEACKFVAEDDFFFLDAGETRELKLRVREDWTDTPSEKKWSVKSLQ
ncbi:MAG: hypothetical protein IJQ31_01895 [Thermoguttaceae bacterium]|nr:hypothetical protein [Thermoguttaceae bacterium]